MMGFGAHGSGGESREGPRDEVDEGGAPRRRPTLRSREGRACVRRKAARCAQVWAQRWKGLRTEDDSEASGLRRGVWNRRDLNDLKGSEEAGGARRPSPAQPCRSWY